MHALSPALTRTISPPAAHVELPASLLAPPTNPNPAVASTSSPPAPTSLPKETKEKKKKHHLTAGTDPLFRELRDLNFSHVGKKLSRVARRLEEDYKVRVHDSCSACCRC
jgi:hypothetical protein